MVEGKEKYTHYGIVNLYRGVEFNRGKSFLSVFSRVSPPC